MYLLSYLTILSGHLHKLQGWYRHDNISPNLFSLLITPSAMGKAAMGKAVDIFSFLEGKGNEYAPLISINGTFKSIISRLNHNNGTGILHDDEIEALSKFLKHDVNGMSFLLKQGYDNRLLRNGRVLSNQQIIVAPKFSFLTAGNAHQLSKVVPSTLDGAYSRNLYYTFSEIQPFDSVKPEGWKHFFDQREEYTEQLGNFINYTLLNPFEFSLTDEQFEKIRIGGVKLQAQYDSNEFPNMDQVIKRSGRTLFKVAMSLAAFRKYAEGNMSKSYVCNDSDFETAFSIIDTLVLHAYQAGEILNNEGKQKVVKGSDRKSKLLEAMPDCFNRQQAISAVKELKLGISDRTVDNYLSQMNADGVLTHTHDNYCKAEA